MTGHKRGRQARPRDAQATRPDGRSPANPYAPKFVVHFAINPDCRARHPELPLTLCEALEIGRTPQPREPEPDPEPEPEPDPELEAEP